MSKLGPAKFQPLITIVTPSFNQGDFMAMRTMPYGARAAIRKLR